MYFHWSALVALCACVPALAAGQADSATIREVLTAEDLRFAAMEFADTEALGQLLAPELTYNDTDGKEVTRAELLRSISSRVLKYAGIFPDARQVRVEDGSAVVVGQARMRVESRGQNQAYKIRYRAVYRHAATGWQLVAWQATRLPP